MLKLCMNRLPPPDCGWSIERSKPREVTEILGTGGDNGEIGSGEVAEKVRPPSASLSYY